MTADRDNPLTDREVLLCVTGGIACYKAADLASRLVARGTGVTVAMTNAATRFVTPLTFQALTRRRVATSLWNAAEDYRSQHLALTEAADVMVIAPATANTLAKMAAGIADELVSALALSAPGACELLVAPAMNNRMWAAPATQDNVATLRGRGMHVVGPAEGRLACGTSGIGRMAEPEQIVAAICELIAPAV
ncbi:MAG: hypothetical protein KGY99_06960 [Phycisphaerae bacterium]|nr:hypothetical protein [Phycisphaerae bacterium]